MALEAVVFSQQQAAGHFGYGGRAGDSPYAVPWYDLLHHGGGGGGFGGDLSAAAGEWDHDLDTACWTVGAGDWEWEALSRDQSSDASTDHGGSRKASAPEPPAPAAAAGTRRKRRRTKVVKNKEEIESQRMTHIAIERNRRRQMNEYLAVLRSLMPPSYAHRGDQASIVGGAINYVRELEQLLQSLEAQKSIKSRRGAGGGGSTGTDAGGSTGSPFASFFSFPQYTAATASPAHGGGGCSAGNTSNGGNNCSSDAAAAGGFTETGRRPAVADIEVTMVEGHASLKVLARRRPKQLLKLVAGLHQLRIPPLHLNVTTVDAMVLYSFSLKVEDDSKMGSVEDIATAVHEILGSIQQQQEETAVM